MVNQPPTEESQEPKMRGDRSWGTARRVTRATTERRGSFAIPRVLVGWGIPPKRLSGDW
jgi:hypothetical protein